MILIDGRKIRVEILGKVKKEVTTLSFQPVFCDVLVGDDPASMQYVKMKADMAVSVGMRFHNAFFPSTITTEELAQEVKKINNIENMCGIIVQLPLPPSIDKRKVLDSISPELDVDCLGTVASENFYRGDTEGGFPTALACMAILDTLGLDLRNKKIVVLGQGDLVGKPISALLHFRNLEPIVVRSNTVDKAQLIKEADVVISGIGKGQYITGEMIKQGAVIIDAGTSEGDGGIVGDVDLQSIEKVAGFVSPVPGGVGPVTVAMLLLNVLAVARQKNESKN